jgi:hypothetical protein
MLSVLRELAECDEHSRRRKRAAALAVATVFVVGVLVGWLVRAAA